MPHTQADTQTDRPLDPADTTNVNWHFIRGARLQQSPSQRGQLTDSHSNNKSDSHTGKVTVQSLTTAQSYTGVTGS